MFGIGSYPDTHEKKGTLPSRWPTRLPGYHRRGFGYITSPVWAFEPQLSSWWEIIPHVLTTDVSEIQKSSWPHHFCAMFFRLSSSKTFFGGAWIFFYDDTLPRISFLGIKNLKEDGICSPSFPKGSKVDRLICIQNMPQISIWKFTAERAFGSGHRERAGGYWIFRNG